MAFTLEVCFYVYPESYCTLIDNSVLSRRMANLSCIPRLDTYQNFAAVVSGCTAFLFVCTSDSELTTVGDQAKLVVPNECIPPSQ